MTHELRARGVSVSMITGGEMSNEERDRVFDEFKNERSRVLIGTDLVARGIDVAAVRLVINFDLPSDKYGKPVRAQTRSAAGGVVSAV